MSNIFTLTGTFGCGKTTTAVSFVPQDWPVDKTPIRVLIDPEMRWENYKSPDSNDHPEKLQYAFKTLGTPRVHPEAIIKLWKEIHQPKLVEEINVVIVDDTAMFQDLMLGWWRQSQVNLRETAAIYGMEKARACVEQNYKPYDAGTINFMKQLFIQWMLDLKEKGITLILTSPLHNVWVNYGMKGTAADGLPNMRVVGKSAKVLDCWQQMTDVIWFLVRTDKNGKLMVKPRVVMDNFIAKAALPGVPEQFDWPGWATIWKWHKERTYLADVGKLAGPEKSFDPEMIEKMIIEDKRRLVKELEGQATLAQVKEAMASEFAPEYTVDKDYSLAAAHEEAKKFILRWVAEHKEADRAAHIFPNQLLANNVLPVTTDIPPEPKPTKKNGAKKVT